MAELLVSFWFRKNVRDFLRKRRFLGSEIEFFEIRNIFTSTFMIKGKDAKYITQYLCEHFGVELEIEEETKETLTN